MMMMMMMMMMRTIYAYDEDSGYQAAFGSWTSQG
jgi:hypothetical protein